MSNNIIKKVNLKNEDLTWTEYQLGATASNVDITIDGSKTNVNAILQNLNRNSRKPREITEGWDVINTILSTGSSEYFRVGDYLNFSEFFLDSNGDPIDKNVKFYVIGVDTHTGTFKTDGTQVGHHIDFCGYSYFKFLNALSQNNQSVFFNWSSTNDNNNSIIAEDGTLITAYEKSYVNKQLKEQAGALQGQMVRGTGISGQGGSDLYPNFSEKTIWLETRYNDEVASLEESNGKKSFATPLWCLTEYEMLGSCIYSSQKYSSGFVIQYPFFQSPENRHLILQGLSIVDTTQPTNRFCTFPNAAEGFNTKLASYDLLNGSNTMTCQGSAWGDCPICFRIEEGFEPV